MTTAKLIGEVEDALRNATHERALARERHRQEVAEFDTEVRRLTAALRALRATGKSTRSAARQAGPGALAKVRELLGEGPETQRKIVHRTGLNDGTVSYALRALVESGEIETCGLVDGSRQFRLKAARRARRVA